MRVLRLVERLARCSDASARRSSQAASPEPVGRRVAAHGGGVHEGTTDRSPQPKSVAVEERPVAELAVEVGVDAGDLLGGARQQLVGGLAGGALKDAHLEHRPVDGLVVGVAELLEHAHAGARRAPLGSSGGSRPAVLEVFEDDGRIEDRGVAVDQRRHFLARVGGLEPGSPPQNRSGMRGSNSTCFSRRAILTFCAYGERGCS